MKKQLLSCVAAVTALSCVLCACGGGEKVTPDYEVEAFAEPAATFTIDGEVNEKTLARNTISDTLFGVFLEDINYAGYLLDDNLLYNGSFETFDSNKTVGWTNEHANLTVSSDGGVLADKQYYKDKGVNANYATVNVTLAEGGSISNAGRSQLPIAVEKGVKYTFSAFVKTATAGAKMKVAVKDETKTYCEADISLKEGGWVKYEQTLTASDSASKNVKLELTFDRAGTYSVDAVALETQNSTGGIKQYAYDIIKELGPKFVRFPGGCIIEGDGGNGGANTQEVYDWKNSVGAVQTGDNAGDDTVPAFEYTLIKDGAESAATTYGEWATRKQNGDLWGYDMEYGIGFYEYFLLCDNLGASAVPVLNCGLSCQGGGATNPTKLNGRHNQQVNDYIQDAIDLIEFAKGDTSTKWGGIRAKLGHPEPFEMRYIGIGNEQSGTQYYQDCYEEFLKSEDFQKALKDYGVKPIVGNAMHFGDCQNGNTKGTAQLAAESAVKRNIVDTVNDFGVHDQHYYVNYSVLFSNTEMYEDYARPDEDGYYEVFVGEYSANENIDSYKLYENSLITALSEAAMMTGYENNGDIIKLAAYAPMFGVANGASNPATGGAGNQWAVDMMYYTNTQIVKSANYYIQQLFMQNQGKYRLSKSKLKYAAGVEETCTLVTESTAKKTINKLYTVASKAENGDLILKVVNASGEDIDLNIAVENAKPKGIAYFTEVSSKDGDWKAINTLKEEKVTSTQAILGFSGDTFGKTIKAYSAVCFRLTVK